MKILFFNAQQFEILHFDKFLKENGQTHIELSYCPQNLTVLTAPLASGYQAVVSFVNDVLDEACLDKLKGHGIKCIFLRSAGFNHVDLKAAFKHQIPVYRVPAYSPEAIAEHAMTLLMTLNRKTHKAFNRVREMNFSLEGLVGFNLNKKKIGVVGIGKIGKAFARIAAGFGCEILLYDIEKNNSFLNEFSANTKIRFVSKDELLSQSDIISFHCPLNEGTKYFINIENVNNLKKDIILINTSRGAVIETKALISGLKKKLIGGAALDVYEFESELFFSDHSVDIIQDDVISRLITFPNVLITAHQGFLTYEALDEIAEITIKNINDFIQFGLESKSTNRIIFNNSI